MLPENRSARLKQITQIKQWFGQLWNISEEANLMVTELACHEPDCPPVETAIVLFEPGKTTRQWKLHKPLIDVTREELAQLLADSIQATQNCPTCPQPPPPPNIRGWRCPD